MIPNRAGQAAGSSYIDAPEDFFLRPHLYPDKFPGERNPVLPAAVQARYDAQEAAGQLVFESPGAAAE